MEVEGQESSRCFARTVVWLVLQLSGGSEMRICGRGAAVEQHKSGLLVVSPEVR